MAVTGRCGTSRARRAATSWPSPVSSARAQPGLPDHAERARHDFPLRAPPPLAAQPPPGGDRPGAPRGRAGDPRLLLPARLHPRRHADSDRRHRRGGGQLFATDYFDLGKAYLAQTGQLYGEAAAAALGKIYCFGPTFRAEKSKTRRHLTEFWMVEPEVAFNDSDDNMRLQEDFVTYIVARALERRRRSSRSWSATRRRSSGSSAPFPAINYTDAVAMLNAHGQRHRSGATTSARKTRRCSSKDYDRPVFVYQLSEGSEGVLHEGESRRSAHGAVQRLPRARGLRRDHRRLAARGRLRQAARAASRKQG